VGSARGGQACRPARERKPLLTGLGFLRGFSDQTLVEGGEPERLRQRAEQRRRQRKAACAGLTRLELRDLSFLRYGYVEHVPSGQQFRLYRGEILDTAYGGPTAFWLDADGDPVFLGPA
jgi:hypothetical protein